MGPGLEWSELSTSEKTFDILDESEDILKWILNEDVSTDSDGGVDEL